jgi:methylmalonyl-CoA mutase cobalamin-binding subunit
MRAIAAIAIRVRRPIRFMVGEQARLVVAPQARKRHRRGIVPDMHKHLGDQGMEVVDIAGDPAAATAAAAAGDDDSGSRQ